ncbi:hypothetical protein DFH06DRAFT_987125 [Mycena polygramma]|nr:hypothetical protein DFH06DRAFT_987125 [Mycena polygramma]
MTSMEGIYGFLSSIPGLVESVSMEKAMSFVRLAAQLKDEIALAQDPDYDPTTAPQQIPEHVRSFLGGATDMPDEFVSGCWTAFSETIWTYNDNGGSAGRDAQMFRDFGLDHLLSARTLFPPMKQCTTPGCLNSHLLRDKDGLRKVVLFTLSDGACATYSVRLHCSQCKTTYHNNYSVRDGIRTYYAGIPNTIQVGEHQFVEREVLSLFVGLMLISWTSATNAARVYDTCLSKPENRPTHKDWPPTQSYKLRTEHVWDGFLILSLLEDYDERNEILQVPNTGEQSVWFNDAVRERNARFRLCGQPEYAHYCDRCIRVWKDGDALSKPASFILRSPFLIQSPEKLHVLVIDGITIGHPCCGVHDCPEPLITNRHRFCSGHDYREHDSDRTECVPYLSPETKADLALEHKILLPALLLRSLALLLRSASIVFLYIFGGSVDGGVSKEESGSS